jgi:hypothetical protein
MDTSEPTKRGDIPFALRAGADVDECCQGTGLSRSRIYLLMKRGEVEFVKVGKRRIVKVPSLLKCIGL